MSKISPPWLQALLTRRMLMCVLTGFASGLPLFIFFNLMPFWLRKEGVDIKTIGLFALVQFPYTWKFLWAPILDRYALLPMGRRRSWMLITQIVLLGTIAALGFQTPNSDIRSVLILCIVIAAFSATQDVAIDAFRREILPDTELALGNAVHVNAYRIAGLVPGSLALILSDHLSWHWVFAITASFMLLGIMLSLWAPEPNISAAPKTLQAAVVEPFKEFITRAGWTHAALVLIFIFFYKLGDSMCTALASVFYVDMGYTGTEIGSIAKTAGLTCSVIGGLLGGIWMLKLSINRALWLFGVVQLLSILGFAWLAWLGPQAHIDTAQRAALAIVIGFEALGVGLGGAAFVAYIAKNTNPRYTATQFALFTSLAAMPRTFMSAATGYLIAFFGWFDFFLLCAVLGIPGMLLLFKVAPWNEKKPSLANP